MPYGYLGVKPNQKVKNAGILDVTDTAKTTGLFLFHLFFSFLSLTSNKKKRQETKRGKSNRRKRETK